MSPEAAGAFYFTFWSATLLAFVWSRHAVARRIYLLIFFACLLVPGLAGKKRAAWPFHDWHLWGGIQASRGEYYELLVVDDLGQTHLFDSRAIPPLLPTQTHYFARKLMQNEQPDRQDELVEFLLNQSDDYRRVVSSPVPLVRHLAYPKREYGQTWNAHTFGNATSIHRLLARHVRFEIDDAEKIARTNILAEVYYP